MPGKITKPCKECGKEFVSWAYKNKLFCSKECWRANQKVTLSCPTCGKKFLRKRPEQIYCSEKCSPGRPRKPESYITKECPVCGKEFTYHNSWPINTCSTECRVRLADASVTTQCPECGKEFTYYKSWPRKYCSQECSGKNTIANIPNWQPSAFQATCEQCGKEYTTTPKATRGRFCSRECWGQWLETHAPTGPDSPNWRGGYAPYYGANWRQQRRAARKRDNYTCQRCGITEDELGKSLDVHHIRRFGDFTDSKEANKLSNLISLCNACHTTVEWSTI